MTAPLLVEGPNIFTDGLKFLRHTDICRIMDFNSTIAAGVAWIFKNLIDFRVAYVGSQLTSVEIAVLFRISATLFSHGQAPCRVFYKDNPPGSNSQLSGLGEVNLRCAGTGSALGALLK